MPFAERSKTSVQEKVAKQNKITKQILVRELSKLEVTEKQEKKKIDIAKQRFRSRYKKFAIGAVTASASEAINVRMYETHNPGFCYHCNGAIKEIGGNGELPTNEKLIESDDSYNFVKTMLFTNGEIDVEKLLCLHLLAAHAPSNVDRKNCIFKQKYSSHINRDESESNDAWNNLLPRYIMKICNDDDESSLQNEWLPKKCKRKIANDKLRDLELKYENNSCENWESVKSVTADENILKMAVNAFSKKMAIVSSRFNAKENQNDNESKFSENPSIIDSLIPRSNIPRDEFPFFNDYYATKKSSQDSMKRACVEDRVTCAVDSTRSEALRTSNSIATLKILSKSNDKIDPSITMLKKKNFRNIDEIVRNWQEKNARENSKLDDIITIKSSYKMIDDNRLKNNYDDKYLQDFRSKCVRSTSSKNSWDFRAETPRIKKIQYRRCLYLNSPIKSFALKESEYRTVDIFINVEIQKIVNSVLEILQRVNPDKIQRLVDIIKDFNKIRDIFERPEIQNFFDNLLEQKIVTSSTSYAFSRATAIFEIDSRLENLIPDELIAMTLELPVFSGLALSVEDFRNNLFGYSDNSNCTTEFINPNLSQEGIRIFRGTCSKFTTNRKQAQQPKKTIVTPSQKITKPVLAKICREIAERETKQRLDSFISN